MNFSIFSEIESFLTVNLSLDGKLIKIWDSANMASNQIGMKSSSTITNALCKSGLTGYGFKWMYLDNYQQLNLV